MKNNKAGVDEVGRGSLVGPVYAAAVILNKSIKKKWLKEWYKIITYVRMTKFSIWIDKSFVGRVRGFQMDLGHLTGHFLNFLKISNGTILLIARDPNETSH